jgi:hypothetical protein
MSKVFRTCTYEVEDLARKDEAVEGLHQLRNAGGEVPPVDIEEVDVGSVESLEGRLNTDMQGLEAVSGELDLLGNVRVSNGRRVGILRLGQREASLHDSHTTVTLVATKIWSRMPLDSIHSPMKISDSPSWLGNKGQLGYISQHRPNAMTY